MELKVIRHEDRGGICPDCGYDMLPGEVNEHMNQHVMLQRAARLGDHPVSAMGNLVLDAGGVPIIQCFTPELAEHVARLMNLPTDHSQE